MTEDDMKIKIIRIGESENAFEHFDDPVVPLTKEQVIRIEESAKEAFKEMTDFMGNEND